MPWLAALVCDSLFDIALHDAYGNLLGKPTYETYNAEYMNCDLSSLSHAGGGRESFLCRQVSRRTIFVPRPDCLPAWHLVGGKDPIAPEELTGEEPEDGYPVLLRDWIAQDGLTCLKVKLRGNDAAWDYARLVAVGKIAEETGVPWLTTDFNCTVTDPAYVTELLDRLMAEHPRLYQMILYVEQPFPYDLEANPIDVHAVSARKPLFMDESAHEWPLVKLGRTLGWTGVALKTCKTQTGALLTLVLGEGARDDADGAGPDEPDAGGDSARRCWPRMRGRLWEWRRTRCSSTRRRRRPRRWCIRGCINGERGRWTCAR